MRFIFARHGQSYGNVDPTLNDPDPALTPLGEQQADRLGRWLAANQPDIDLIVCSPLQRAHQTAALANAHLHLPIEVHPGLAEIARWDMPLLPRRRHPFDRESIYSMPEQDVAYYLEYREVVRAALIHLTADIARPKPVLVVSHGGTSATLLRIIFERDDMYIRTLNTAMHFIDWIDGHWRIDGLNLTPHLPLNLIS